MSRHDPLSKGLDFCKKTYEKEERKMKKGLIVNYLKVVSFNTKVEIVMVSSLREAASLVYIGLKIQIERKKGLQTLQNNLMTLNFMMCCVCLSSRRIFV